MKTWQRAVIASSATIPNQMPEPEQPNQCQENMTAFLKIDHCARCGRALPWEWFPALVLNGKPLAGTGVWRSQLFEGACADCVSTLAKERDIKERALRRRKEIAHLLGGEKPCRDFTFERFQCSPGNQLAFDSCSRFDPTTDNLYLWGACGVGKTHLACAAARRCFDETLDVAFLPAAQIARQTRMKDPEREQTIIDRWVTADTLVLDDFGAGPDTAYRLQLWQEILDSRHFRDRAGLLITSKYALSTLAHKLGDDAIPSRLAGMCHVIEVKGRDHRLPELRRGK